MGSVHACGTAKSVLQQWGLDVYSWYRWRDVGNNRQTARASLCSKQSQQRGVAMGTAGYEEAAEILLTGPWLRQERLCGRAGPACPQVCLLSPAWGTHGWQAATTLNMPGFIQKPSALLCLCTSASVCGQTHKLFAVRPATFLRHIVCVCVCVHVPGWKEDLSVLLHTCAEGPVTSRDPSWPPLCDVYLGAATIHSHSSHFRLSGCFPCSCHKN